MISFETTKNYVYDTINNTLFTVAFDITDISSMIYFNGNYP